MRLELTNNVRHYSDRVQVIADDKIRNKTIFGTDLYNVYYDIQQLKGNVQNRKKIYVLL